METASRKVFISYAERQQQTAAKLCETLESRGHTCWIAPRNVRAGQEYGSEIIRGIEETDCLVLLYSQEASLSPFVRNEIERAFSKRKPIFTVRLDESTLGEALEFFLSATQWIDLKGSTPDECARKIAEVLSNPTMVAQAKQVAQSRKIGSRMKPVAVKVASFLGLAAAIWLGVTLAQKDRSGPVGSAHTNAPTANVADTSGLPLGGWQADAFGAARGEGGLRISLNKEGKMEIEGNYILDDKRSYFGTGRVPRQLLENISPGANGATMITGEFVWSDGKREARDRKAVIVFLNPSNLKIESPPTNPVNLSTLFTRRVDLRTDEELKESTVVRRPMPSKPEW